MKQLFPGLVIFVFCLLFFSFRLLDVPRGITPDEAAFGYNASLISETGRDENKRFLPAFVLSLDGRDWRQPVTQYSQVITFRLFGRSLFNLKFTSVVVVAVSSLLILFLGTKILGKKFGLVALIIFVSTPVVMIHSHLALDNIMPVPFILLWLIGLWNWQKSNSLKFLVLAGISLGIGFYAHKSMRSAAPVWTVLTVLYLVLIQIKGRKISNGYRPVAAFILGVLPFYLVSPILNYKYAGAVFGTQAISFFSIYDFIYFYISNFDPSFLLIKGDTILHHSTGKHGMFLLASFPFFVYGIYKSFRDRNIFLIFLTVCFFAGPLALGFIGSVYRASRIIFLVPLFSLIASFGFLKLLEIKGTVFKWGLAGFCLIFALNYCDFIKYYWFDYANATYHIFYSTGSIEAYKKLYEDSRGKNLKPLISKSLLDTRGDPGAIENFARSLYFINPQSFDVRGQLPNGSELLSGSENFPAEKKDNLPKGYYLYIKN